MRQSRAQKYLRRAAACFLCIAALLAAGCVSMYSADEAAEEIAWDLADQMYEKPGVYAGKNIAVYYFTENGEPSRISDYLIDTLTSQLAYVVSEESLDLNVLSRQALDRIMQETEFQLSAMADGESQVEIGKQLGADIILTGTITPVDGDYRINAQLIDVSTAAVLYSFIYEFWMD